MMDLIFLGLIFASYYFYPGAWEKARAVIKALVGSSETTKK